MKDVLVGTDRPGKVRVIHAAAESIAGWTADRAVGRPRGEICQIDCKAKGQAKAENRLPSRATRDSPPVATESRAEAVHGTKGGFERIQVRFSPRRRNVVTWPKHPDTPGPPPDAA